MLPLIKKLLLKGSNCVLLECSGVFSTGATGAIAPTILRKRLIAPAIIHLSSLDFNIYILLFLLPLDTDSFFERKNLFCALRVHMFIVLSIFPFCNHFQKNFLTNKSVRLSTEIPATKAYLLLRGETFRGRVLFGSSFAIFTFRFTLSIGN